MASMNKRGWGAVALAAALLSGSAIAAAPGKAPLGTVPAHSSLSPGQRGAAIRQFVQKWGPYVAQNYGVDVRTWAMRIAPVFARGDADNIRDALKRDTFEGAMATLDGVGHRLTDAQAKARLAKLPAVSYAAKGEAISAKFGDLSQDLVYTPVQPCRILDTRSTAAGAIATNSTRSFVAINATNFTSQGGSATNCGTLGLSATAVAINLTAVSPTGAGYATAYPFGTTRPVAASVNYATGAIVNNALVVQIPNPLSSFDFTLYTFAQSHYVADIVGYFAPPLATALQCVDTANTTIAGISPGNTANATAPACPTGYTQTATNCETSSWLMPLVFIHSGTCSARNNDSASQDLRASRTCCRVPGR